MYALPALISIWRWSRSSGPRPTRRYRSLLELVLTVIAELQDRVDDLDAAAWAALRRGVLDEVGPLDGAA
jgi:hypothetical protein